MDSPAKVVLLAAALAATQHAGAGDRCAAQAAPQHATVVELYTSEGCDSCPPADRWISSLGAGPARDGRSVVALAFHVDYWDRLGWTDRFASAAYTERQHQVSAASGARFVYTPQVLVDGRDWRGWPGALPVPGTAEAPALSLQRDGAQVVAHVGARPGQRLSAYWALVEDGHVSQVRSGENAGRTLHHDHVVRQYEPVPAWEASQPRELHWRPMAASEPHPRRVVLVLTDAATGRPLQALELGC